jgi:acetylornithine deacetylase/succinyl-diaminopimelate desuccinylase-like protein
MDLERLLKITLEIQAIPAPTFKEEIRAEYVRAAFDAIGLKDISVDKVGNVYGRLKGGDGHPLILTAHMDSVFPIETSLGVTHEDNRIIGAGIGDNAVALGVLLELPNDLQISGLRSDVWFVGTVGEEGLGNLLGMKDVVRRFGEEVSGYIVIEGMALGYIYHRGLPISRFRIEANTMGGHSWIHAGRPSAVHALIRLSSELIKLDLPQSPKTTLNIGRIQGGTSINTIASHAEIEIDIRSDAAEEIGGIETQIRDLTAGMNTDEVTIEMTNIGTRPAGAISKKHPLVLAALDSYKAIAKEICILEGGSTDASYPLSLGLPAICVGITKGGGAHSLNEYIEISPIERGYAALLDLIERFTD